jgi:hypothetical protein
MYRFLIVGIAILIVVLLSARMRLAASKSMAMAGQATTGSISTIALTVSSDPLIKSIPRIGVNLGGWTFYGAEQYRQNVLMNPGFEPTVEGRILEVTNPTGTTFQDDANYVGKGPPDWYVGATFSVRSGVSAGVTGQISGYNPNGGDNPTFACKGGCPTLKAHDEISMYFTDPPVAGVIQPTSAGWWTSDKAFIQSNTDHEPHSSGTYSLQTTLDGDSHALHSYIDSWSPKPIVYLPVIGPWRISFWAKAVRASSPSIKVSLVRESDGTHGNTTFIDNQNFSPTDSWQQFRFDFAGVETANTGTLVLTFTFTGASGGILMDDVFLGAITGSVGGWRKEVVSTLKTLHPGVLRDWQNSQLGEPFLYRTGDDTAHGPSSFNGPSPSPAFTYTITDFLALAQTIGAEPWIIIPDTATDAELQDYGSYLERQQAKYHFPEILIELGNENWNGVFRGAGIILPANYGAVAQRDFILLKRAASNDSTLKFVGGGQYGNPDQVHQVAKDIPAASYIAAAPYFWECQDTGQTIGTYLTQMFNDGWSNPANEMIPIAQGLRPGQIPAIYEVNLSTLGGSATTAERVPIVAGYGSGAALEQQILRAMNSGFKIQNAWCFTQLGNNAAAGVWGYSGQCANNPPAAGAQVPLFGIVHDLNRASNLIRPTGLAVELANMAIAGDFYPVNTSAYPGISGAAFLSGGRWTGLFSNGTSSYQSINLTFPQGALPTTLKQLAYAKGPTDVNERSSLVSIASGRITSVGDNQVSFAIPPWGAVALLR